MIKTKKRLLTGLYSLLLLLGVGITSTSCSAFFGDDGYLIENISHYTDGEGNVVVTLYFDSDEVEPLTITIPKGDSGEQGRGISNIEYEVNEDNESVDIIIYYSDNSQPTTINVPIINGEDGRGVENVIVDQDEEENMTIKFEYSDGSSSEEFVIPKGEDGRGIETIESNPIEGTNISIITITYTDGTSSQFQISNGEDGRGIVSIAYDEASSTETAYALIITYTNEETETIYLPRPQSTKWYTGASDPTSTLGINGDFYLNIASGEVFLKQNNIWVAQFNMKGSGDEDAKTYYNVTFTLGEGESWSDPQDGDSSIIVRAEEGSTLPLEEIPVPVRNGSTFLGWFTSLETNINSGQFTDLTPILKDITLFAHWSIE